MVAIRLAPSALEDLAEIQRHYDTEGAPDAGRRIVAEIVNHIEQLAEHPEIERVVSESIPKSDFSHGRIYVRNRFHSSRLGLDKREGVHRCPLFPLYRGRPSAPQRAA